MPPAPRSTPASSESLRELGLPEIHVAILQLVDQQRLLLRYWEHGSGVAASCESLKTSDAETPVPKPTKIPETRDFQIHLKSIVHHTVLPKHSGGGIFPESWNIEIRGNRSEDNIIMTNGIRLRGGLQQLASELTGRVSHKIREIESLRYGLFNAKSVHEAIKGTQINQFLLVFTIVTILYLPPYFVAAFYGMDLSVNEDYMPVTRTRFWIVLAVISGVTYMVAVMVLSSAEQVKNSCEVSSYVHQVG
ncbi:hypothetical protein QBC44DRAFT_311209 [Cladorrhinum sp. PSN332]|nr:hypothetical protein QBC44DRAFT_311209 [Cladorrhinum sp. PSN332]